MASVFLVLVLSVFAATTGADLALQKMIVFSRHGIRMPFSPSPYGAQVFSRDNRNWFTSASDWGAGGPAYLTNHGAQVLQVMGNYCHSTWVDQWHLLSDSCDPSQFTIYSDYDSTERDVNTAHNFFSTLVPSCPNVTVNADPTYSSYLFNTGGLNVSDSCSGPSLDLVLGMLGGNASKLSQEFIVPIMALNDAIDCCQPVVCNNSTEDCTLAGIPTSWNGEYFQYFNGPLFSAASIGEYLELMYLNGMNYSEVTNENLQQIEYVFSIHQANLLLTENDWATQDFGSELMLHILLTMEQIMYNYSVPELLSSPSNTLVYYAGHDINIYFLRNFLRLNWITDSYNSNDSPLGGMLLFQLLTDNSSEDEEVYIRLFFSSQSYDQQREIQELGPSNPPDTVPVIVPRCTSGPEHTCPLSTFRYLVLDAIRKECTHVLSQETVEKYIAHVASLKNKN